MFGRRLFKNGSVWVAFEDTGSVSVPKRAASHAALSILNVVTR